MGLSSRGPHLHQDYEKVEVDIERWLKEKGM